MKLRLPILLALLAITLMGLSLVSIFNNPEIDTIGRGHGYQCLAPWDTVLNHADNIPGGDPPVDWRTIGADCRAAGRAAFAWGVAAGIAGVLAWVLGFAVLLRRRTT